MAAVVQVDAAKVADSLGRKEEEGRMADDDDTICYERICLHLKIHIKNSIFHVGVPNCTVCMMLFSVNKSKSKGILSNSHAHSSYSNY